MVLTEFKFQTTGLRDNTYHSGSWKRSFQQDLSPKVNQFDLQSVLFEKEILHLHVPMEDPWTAPDSHFSGLPRELLSWRGCCSVPKKRACPWRVKGAPRPLCNGEGGPVSPAAESCEDSLRVFAVRVTSRRNGSGWTGYR